MIQYSWVFIVSLLAIIVIPYDFPRKTGTFHLDKQFQPINGRFPLILLHISDIHLSSIKPKSYPYIKNILNHSKFLIKPDLLVVAGDITDNYNDPNAQYHHYNKLYEEDWKLYKKLMNELNINIITNETQTISLNTKKNYLQSVQVFGNHDYYLTDSFNSPNNYMRGIINSTDVDDFELSTTKIKFSAENYDMIFKFIKLNRVAFPTGPISLHQNSYLTPRFKKRFLNAITEDNDMKIVVSHTPLLKYFYFKTMMSLVKQAKNTRFFLTGHWHPFNGFFQHFGRESYETVTPGLFKRPLGDVVIIDNGVSSNHIINLSQTRTAIITHPTPNDQRSELDHYSPSDGEIRAISFGVNSNKMNLSILIDDHYIGQLKCTENEYKENVYLCTLKYSKLSNGVHKLTQIGDWNGSFSFSIGPESPSLTEIDYIYETEVEWTILFLLSWIFAVYILWPFSFRFINFNNNNLIGLNIYESDSKSDTKSFHFNPLKKIKKSFIVLKSHLHSLPSYFLYMFDIGVFWSLFLPICAFETKGRSAYFHVLGNFFLLQKTDIDQIKEGSLQNFRIGSLEYRYHYYGAMHGVYFLYFHIFAIFIMISSFHSYQAKKYLYVLIDCCLFLLSLWGGYYQFSWLIEMFGFFYAFTSPLMFWFPLIYYILLVYWIINEKRKIDLDESTEVSQSLLIQI